MDVGSFFIDFLPQHGMAKLVKTVDSSTFFHTFCYLRCWAVGFDFRLIFDCFLIDFGVENLSKIYQKSIQKAIENNMKVGMDFGWLLDRFLVDFGPKLGVKLWPSLHKNLKKWGAKTMSTKSSKI